MANSLHNRLLHAIAEDDAALERDDAANDIAAVNLRGDEQWWDHLITNFFHHDEMALFTDLRIDRGVFNVILNAIEDLPLQTRGRRSFIHSHREQLLFLHVLPEFGTSVPSLIVTPRIKSVCGCTGSRGVSRSSTTGDSRTSSLSTATRAGLTRGASATSSTAPSSKSNTHAQLPLFDSRSGLRLRRGVDEAESAPRVLMRAGLWRLPRPRSSAVSKRLSPLCPDAVQSKLNTCFICFRRSPSYSQVMN